MFVKFNCGCKGFVFENTTWVFDACDRADYNETYTITERDMEDKTYVPLTLEEMRPILNELGSLIHDGYNHRLIRHLFQHKPKEK